MSYRNDIKTKIIDIISAVEPFVYETADGSTFSAPRWAATSDIWEALGHNYLTPDVIDALEELVEEGLIIKNNVYAYQLTDLI